jgi:hypothetical protein
MKVGKRNSYTNAFYWNVLCERLSNVTMSSTYFDWNLMTGLHSIRKLHLKTSAWSKFPLFIWLAQLALLYIWSAGIATPFVCDCPQWNPAYSISDWPKYLPLYLTGPSQPPSLCIWLAQVCALLFLIGPSRPSTCILFIISHKLDPLFCYTLSERTNERTSTTFF